jgi:hypothetical protein
MVSQQAFSQVSPRKVHVSVFPLIFAKGSKPGSLLRYHISTWFTEGIHRSQSQSPQHSRRLHVVLVCLTSSLTKYGSDLQDKLGLQPLQIIWLKACVKFFTTACTSSRGNPLLWEAMRANVELSRDCHKAWCARLAWFLKCIGVLSCEETCATRPVQTWWLKPLCSGLRAAGNNSFMGVLQCKTRSCTAFAPRRWVKNLGHIHICMLGCAFHNSWC